MLKNFRFRFRLKNRLDRLKFKRTMGYYLMVLLVQHELSLTLLTRKLYVCIFCLIILSNGFIYFAHFKIRLSEGILKCPIKYQLAHFMYDRYGVDELSRTILVILQLRSIICLSSLQGFLLHNSAPMLVGKTPIHQYHL